MILNKTILIISSDKLDSEGMSRRLASEITTVYLACLPEPL